MISDRICVSHAGSSTLTDLRTTGLFGLSILCASSCLGGWLETRSLQEYLRLKALEEAEAEECSDPAALKCHSNTMQEIDPEILDEPRTCSRSTHTSL
jgi:hypothetical protein